MLLTSTAYRMLRNKNEFHSTLRLSSSESKSDLSLAIVGGGFAGLGCAYSVPSKYRITVLDFNLPGFGGASSAAAGMMHPMTPQGGIMWKGVEAYQSTINLMNDVGISSFQNVNIIRPCFTEKHMTIFSKAVAKHPEVIRSHSFLILIINSF